MTTLYCKQNGCDYHVTKPTEGRAKIAIAMHTRRHHKNAVGPTAGRLKRSRKLKRAQIMVNFCPECGCNLHNVAMALALVGGAK